LRCIWERVYCQPRCRSLIGLAAEGRGGIVNDTGTPGPRRHPLLVGRRLVLSAVAAGILASGALLGLAPAPSAAASTASAKPLAVTTSSLPAANGGVSYSAKLAATGGTTPYTWSITAGTLPTGLTLHTNGVINGIPTSVGTADFTVTVTDSETPNPATASAAESITANVTPLAVTTAFLPAAPGGSSYKTTLTATGGIKPYTWSITAGALPAGLTLHPATGVISGTSKAVGTADFTVTVTDSETPNPATASAAESITVEVAPLQVTTVTLPQGTVGTLYSATLAATGGIPKYTWSITAGTLPAGLKLHPATGLISGTPTGTGTTDFTVTVTDTESPPASASVAESITIPAPVEVTTVSLPAAVVGTPYTATLTAVGGVPPYAWSIPAGTLPAGLTLDPSTGVITGTPSAPGNASFTVEVTDSGSPPASAVANEVITLSVAPLVVTTTSLPAAITGKAYSSTLTATGGGAPYTCSITPGTGALPAGLTLDPSTGVITGTPTVTGTADFTVTVTDSSSPPGAAEMPLSITVAQPLVVTTTSLPAAITGKAYSSTLTATGGVAPYIWSITPGTGALPAGLTLDPSTGVITGTPTASGAFDFTVTVTDSSSPPGAAEMPLSITVAQPLVITTPGLQDATVGSSYSATLTATGGVAPYTWSITAGTLPAGLTLDPSTGVITGTPTASGAFDFTVTVTDSNSPPASSSGEFVLDVE
jgi:Putative Ig domain